MTFKKLLEEHNITGYGLAKATGIGKTTILYWISNKRDPKGMSFENADKICKALNISLEELKQYILHDTIQ